MQNARAAINRLFRENNRRLDTVKDSEFHEAKDMLGAKLKTNLKSGLNLPTRHKPIILTNQRRQISNYLKSNTPVCLRYRVWYMLSIQYGTKGLEFHPQLNKSRLKVKEMNTFC
ncbi:hypothetical protein DPMN_085408 [Dreissena polymorpha]|uniref:Uncharacterized protein n=1 Tax=Dreissena polymorpha TaxID=45954 RepID=A0A9D4BCU8_DREPO|nr:hypothetical protein DPMN_085408 [Dreissena polymorpha]